MQVQALQFISLLPPNKQATFPRQSDVHFYKTLLKAATQNATCRVNLILNVFIIRPPKFTKLYFLLLKKLFSYSATLATCSLK